MLIPYGHSGWTTLWPQCLKLTLQSHQTKSQSTYLTDDLVSAIRRKLKLYKDARHLNTDCIWSRYHKLCNHVTTALRRAKPTIIRLFLLNWNHQRTFGLSITSSFLRSPGLLLILNTMMNQCQHHLRKLTFSMSFLFLFYSQLSTQYSWFSIQTQSKPDKYQNHTTCSISQACSFKSFVDVSVLQHALINANLCCLSWYKFHIHKL